jgi:hypothetical protein
MSEEEEPVHFLRRWISFGDILTMVASIAIFTGGYTSLTKDVDQIKVQLADIQKRDITPGAAVRLSAVEARDTATERDVQQMREDSAVFRAEVRAQLDRIEDKIDASRLREHTK